jgi:hypothetical protein
VADGEAVPEPSSGCLETSGPSFNGPSGAAVNTAKCSVSSTGCMQNASKTCGGPYLVLDSESYSGVYWRTQ